MGLITIPIPDDLEKKLKDCGAHVETIIERALRQRLKEPPRSNGSSAESENWEQLA